MQFRLRRTRMVDDIPCLRPLHLVLAEPSVRDEFIHGQVILTAHHRLVLEPDNHLGVVEACGFHARAQTREHRVGIEDVHGVIFREIRNDRAKIPAREVLVFLFALKVVVCYCFRLIRAEFYQSLLILDVGNTIRRVGDDRAYFVLADDLADERSVERVAARDDVVADFEDVSVSCFHGFSWPLGW
jgi:hypothetical protein